MLRYILNRFIYSLLTVFIVITLVFFLMRLMPGGPFDGEKVVNANIKRNMEAKFGLNKPIIEQYVIYLGNLLRGDLGPSMLSEGRSVNRIIEQSFPVSAKLGIVTIIVILIAGINIGIVSALNQNKFLDRFFMVLATIGVTVPSFVMCAFLIYLFATILKIMPATGLTTPLHYVLPTIALAGYSLAFVSRLMRSRLLDVISEDYIRTAKAKGESAAAVIFKHALKNAIIPVITYTGPLVAGILTGSFIIERMFAIPGLGREFIMSISNRDYTLVLGVTVFYCVFVIAMNFLVDIIYGFVDPRIRLDGSKA